VQRVRKALEPPGEARPDIEIIARLAAAMGHDWGAPSAEQVWNEVRSLSPMHAGMSYRRLEAMGGIQWPCYDESHPGEQFIHGRLWKDPIEGPPAPFIPTEWEPPVDQITDEYPLRLTTGRHLDSYNTGVQSDGFDSPLRIGGTLDISLDDADRLGIKDGELVRVASRRGAVEVAARLDPGLREGLVFMPLHYPGEADVNRLTIEAWDPKSGTAEFKATAVRVERM
jgi:formate dehydrogenase major subunit